MTEFGDLEPWAQPAAEALAGYGLGPVEIRLLSVRENAVFLVTTAEGRQRVLRLCRPGYRTIEQVDSEMAWVNSLHEEDVVPVPATIPDRDGKLVHLFLNGNITQAAVLSEFIAGVPPEMGDTDRFRTLGRLSALLHNHAESWARPAGWTRPAWNLDTAVGVHAAWGDWRQSTRLTRDTTALFEAAERDVRTRLAGAEGAALTTVLVHGDLHAGNLLVSDETVYLLDFDDCGSSWPLWELACSLVDGSSDPSLASQWLSGYLSMRDLTPADLGSAGPLIMLRILLIVGWLETHQHATPDGQNEEAFDSLVALTRRYLVDRFSL